MTTIQQTFNEDSKTGKAIAEIVELMEGGDLERGNKLAVTEWLYMNYRVSKDIEVVPDPTP